MTFTVSAFEYSNDAFVRCLKLICIKANLEAPGPSEGEEFPDVLEIAEGSDDSDFQLRSRLEKKKRHQPDEEKERVQ